MRKILTILIAISSLLPGYSQGLDEELFAESAAEDSARVKELRLDIDATLFFRDNEFETHLMKGYTLPGFRLRPSVSYSPTPSVKVEAGVYMLRFWGADRYPNLAYRNIAYWNGTGRSTPGLHFVPFLRGRMTLPFGLTVVLGSLYGGASHRLPEPMYAPELNLTADPETGLQLLYSNDRVNVDGWINWESFTYRGAHHQEAFVAGFSTQVNLTRPSSLIKAYMPVAAVFQHRGGEIDTLVHNSVQTVMNATAGIGASYTATRRWFKGAAIEADAMLYKQLTGDLWPYESGWALWLHGHADFKYLRLKAGYMRGDKFLPLFGYPLYGSMSNTDERELFGKVSTLMAGAEFYYEFAPGYTLGADLSLYHQPGLTAVTESTGESRALRGTNSVAFGMYMRICPSFLLKKL